MSTRGVIFTADEVRATLDGRKTQFRRLLTVPNGRRRKRTVPREPYYCEDRSTGELIAFDDFGDDWPIEKFMRCPFGNVGDRIWCKETWAVVSNDPCCGCDVKPCAHEHVEYRADTGNKYPGNWPDDAKDDPECGRWRSSIQMPQSASRLTLEVTGVRVQRVTDITEEDAKAEGHKRVSGYHTASTAFRFAWDTRNPKHPWDSKPWAWVVEFKVAGSDL